MPILDMKGMELYYELHGSGKPLVLIAGYKGFRESFKLS